MKKQCSIEWFFEQINILDYRYNGRVITLGEYVNEKNRLELQARQMYEKEIIESWENGYTHGASANDEPSIYHGTQYYKNTYENS